MNNKAHKTIQAIAKRLANVYRPRKIILFGSYAHDIPRSDSDIDILVILNTSLPFYKRLAEIRKTVFDIRSGYPFEPIVLTPSEVQERLAAGDQFLSEILKKGKTLYAS